MTPKEFYTFLMVKGHELYRPMPWREKTDPYSILVSELMLQQTQVDRVRPKFIAFMEHFPTIAALAEATPAEVIEQWQGLGYNRRALYLQRAAQMVRDELSEEFPSTYESLQRLPGVGPNTAGAIMAYAYDQPVVYIETNIRTVFMYHYFSDDTAVDDRSIRELVGSTMPKKAVREYYWALMDYGAYLKKSGVRMNSRSSHYKKQSRFAGSLREMRGVIIRELTLHSSLSVKWIKEYYPDDPRIDPAIDGLMKDGLVKCVDSQLHLTKHP